MIPGFGHALLLHKNPYPDEGPKDNYSPCVHLNKRSTLKAILKEKQLVSAPPLH